VSPTEGGRNVARRGVKKWTKVVVSVCNTVEVGGVYIKTANILPRDQLSFALPTVGGLVANMESVQN